MDQGRRGGFAVDPSVMTLGMLSPVPFRRRKAAKKQAGCRCPRAAFGQCARDDGWVRDRDSGIPGRYEAAAFESISRFAVVSRSVTCIGCLGFPRPASRPNDHLSTARPVRPRRSSGSARPQNATVLLKSPVLNSRFCPLLRCGH
jgi:hypothetical protein